MSRRLRDLCRPHRRSARCRPGEMHLEGRAGKALAVARRRLVVAGMVFLLVFAGIGYRVFDLSVIRAGAGTGAGQARMAATETLPAGHRADIVDRHGIVLATSIRAWSIYADPALVADPGRTARILAHIFPRQNARALEAKLRRKSRFVWIGRQASPAAWQRILRFGLAGIHARPELRRIYPQRAPVAHIVGSSDVDNRGTAGVEARMNTRLRTGTRPLRLAIDLRAQIAVRRILARSVARWQALGGAAVAMDVATGEIPFMVSLPDYDPYHPETAPKNARFNRNTLGVYELGSVFKVLNTAMALHYGVTDLEETFRIDKPLPAGRRFIRDMHPVRKPADIGTILVKSSNIGSAMLGRRIGAKRQKAFLRRLGMLKKIPLELPEAGQPLYPRRWRPVNTLTISFGHGIAVTPVHLVAAVAGIVNDGVMVAPTLLRRDNGKPLWRRRVVSSKTSRIVRGLMRRVVLEGSGMRADARGYRVGGKTGTAEKVGRGGYRREALLSSFVAAFPIDRPRYVLLVSLDEPKGSEESEGLATAGWVAAPAARRIIERVAPILRVARRAEPAPESAEALVASTADGRSKKRRAGAQSGRSRR